MDIKNCAVGTRFWTAYAGMDYSKPVSSITQWELICPDHGVAMLVGYGGEPNPKHVSVFTEPCFDSPAEAWKAAAVRLQSIVDNINKEIEECMKKAEPKLEEAA